MRPLGTPNLSNIAALTRLTGFKSYCCKDITIALLPPAFQQCNWSSDLPKLGEKACKASCPPNHLKLAVQPRKCAAKGGMEAMCCQGIIPSQIPNLHPPEPEHKPPKKSDKLLDFDMALDRYTFVPFLL
jgi:hypothetical protein